MIAKLQRLDTTINIILVGRDGDGFVTISGYGVIALVIVIVAGERVESPAWNKVIAHDPAARAVSVYTPALSLTVQIAELALALVMATDRSA